ncbi:MAG: methyltransferase domain-containing protein [Pseudomonadota bacterium]
MEQPQFSRDGWTCVQCLSCGMRYLSEAPAYAALSETLAWSKQFSRETKARKRREPMMAFIDQKTRWRLRLFRDNEWEYLLKEVPEGRVLDVGCSARNNLPPAYTPYGIEIAKDAAAIADAAMQKVGGRAVHAPAIDGLDQFADGFFDGMVMRSYIEHEAEPKAVLSKAHAKLRNGGVIYVKAPNFGTINRMVRGVNWCGFRFPDHLNYFDVTRMRKLAAATGFKLKLKNTFSRLTNDNFHAFLIKV